ADAPCPCPWPPTAIDSRVRCSWCIGAALDAPDGCRHSARGCLPDGSPSRVHQALRRCTMSVSVAADGDRQPRQMLVVHRRGA
ncbi:MAG: hypothetical protein NTY19_15505, partial [Planctomycetota bacterium]|nr:hypothetical protein [Planctomycetota bacterium]